MIIKGSQTAAAAATKKKSLTILNEIFIFMIAIYMYNKSQ